MKTKIAHFPFPKLSYFENPGVGTAIRRRPDCPRLTYRIVETLSGAQSSDQVPEAIVETKAHSHNDNLRTYIGAILISRSGESFASDSAQQEALNIAESVYSLDENGHCRLAIDYIIDQMDDRLNTGEFRTCDRTFQYLDPKKLSETSIVTFLGITLAARSRLPARKQFYRRAMDAVALYRGPEGANKLLNKYR